MCDENEALGLADWRKPENYEYPIVEKGSNISIESIKFWKWQFIRRCPVYQNDWREYVKNSEKWKVTKKNGTNKKQEIIKKYNLECLEDPNNYRINPFIEASSRLIPRSFPAANLDLYERAMKQAEDFNDHIAIINPYLPIKTQIDQIKLDIKSWKNEFNSILEEQGKAPIEDSRLNLNRYPLYIRLIDARRGRKSGKPPTWECITKYINNENGFAGYSVSRFQSNHKKAIEYFKKARIW